MVTRLLTVLLCLLIAPAATFAQDNATATNKDADATEKPTAAASADAVRAVEHYNLRDGLALDGYDPVSYFPDGGGKPTKGDKSIQYEHRGVTYRFVNEANRERFKAVPEQYEPAYGGWCAYAVGKSGEKVEVDPKSFTIQDGRLFLFYRDLLTDTRKLWSKSREELQPAAELKWREISGERPVIAAFSLESVGDVQPISFKLSETRGRYVVLHFLLKTACPICQRYTQEYHRAADSFQNVDHVFIKPDSEAEILKWVKGISRRPTIYRDPDAELAARFGIPDGYKFHGETVHFPALIVIDPAGREVFRYVGKNNRDRFELADFRQRFPQLFKAENNATTQPATQPATQPRE